MKSNQYAERKANAIMRIEREINEFINVFQEWSKVQKKYLHLEPIFS